MAQRYFIVMEEEEEEENADGAGCRLLRGARKGQRGDPSPREEHQRAGASSGREVGRGRGGEGRGGQDGGEDEAGRNNLCGV